LLGWSFSRRSDPTQISQAHIAYTQWLEPHDHFVPLPPTKLDQAFAAYIKARRGDRSYAAFAKEVGLDPGSLHRLERAEQSITLGRLMRVLKRLNASLEDVFGPVVKKRFTRRD
jgi:transcriptional regulator with XRE-family HTH domain